VRGYGDVCQAITETRGGIERAISSDDFRTLNRCLDDAIAAAVTEFGSERDQSNDGETAEGTQRLGVLAHKLRTTIHTARGAFDAIQSGRVGVAGSTGTVLDRSLVAADELIERSLTLEVVTSRRSTVKSRA
jgi:ABC-type molybdenum transport system ATPase subunit/photorepair protein PhrA